MAVAEFIDAVPGVWLVLLGCASIVGLCMLRYRIRSGRLVVIWALGIAIGATAMAIHKNAVEEAISLVREQTQHTTTITSVGPRYPGTISVTLKPVARQHRVLIAATLAGSHDVRVGDTVRFTRSPLAIPEATFDFTFDRKRYYRGKGIHQEVFLPESKYSIARGRSSSLVGYSAMARNWLSGRIHLHIADQDAAAMVKAMILGLRGGLDRQTKTMFQRAGAIHILAISGLHIGIVGAILMLLVGNPVRTNPGPLRLIKCIVVILGIWAFTLVSGMSPSACRAAFMFSIYLTGVASGRKSHTLNILGCSAIAFLLIQPDLLYSVSFQFSYLALLGIVVFGIPLARFPVSRHRILQYAWTTIAISVGAQAFLTPLIMHYFGEYSVASPLTSLVAIPAAFAIVAGAVAMLVVGFVLPVAGDLIGFILSFVIGHTNRIIRLVGESDFSTISPVYVTGLECAILMAATVMIGLRVLTDATWTLQICIVLAALFCIVHVGHRVAIGNQFVLTVYRSDSPAIDMVMQGRCSSTLGPQHVVTGDMSKNRAIQYIRHCPSHAIPPSIQTLQISRHDSTLADLIFIAGLRELEDIGNGQKSAIAIVSPTVNWRDRNIILHRLQDAGIRAHDLKSGPFQITIQ